FPTNSKNHKKNCTIDDFIDMCVVDLDLLVATQNYYYSLAKQEYDQKPDTGIKYMFKEGKWEQVEYLRKFRRRDSNSMTWVQFNLSKIFYDEKDIWKNHKELQEEITYKKIDLKLEIEEIESSYSKGEQTSYSEKNTVDDLLFEFGVMVKLQNGMLIQQIDIEKIKNGLVSFFTTFTNLSETFRKYGLIISYSKEKHMHAQNAIGIFSSQFNAIGVSSIGNFDRTLSHELGHLIDYLIGDSLKRNYASDDKNHICGQIAILFRKNTIKRQTSEYKNRSKECFARAIEQFFCIRNDINISEKETHYCHTEKFNERIFPLVLELIKTMQ
ncbi:MAG: hypothetical protein IT222_11450, partial [Crocinitomix sp.]|nr:hypothetical protein [Crocinitomix sp.]